jgi:uncharacterized protein
MSPTANPSPQDVTTSADSRAVVQRYLDAVQVGDAQGVRELFAPDATWQLRGELPISGTRKGRDAILGESLATALGYYEPGSLDLEATSMVAEGEQVALEWVSRARTRAGEPYENFCIGVFTVRDRRIQTVREYMDTLYAHRATFSWRPPATTVAQLLEARDRDALGALLASDVRFHSPVADYDGRDDVAQLLSLIAGVLDDVRVRRQLTGERELTSFLAGCVGEAAFDAVLDEHYDDRGAVVELTLMLRPLSTLRAAIALMGAALEAAGR